MDIGRRIATLRRDHDSGPGLERGNLLDDPFDQFRAWLHDAVAADLVMPNAMTLATCDGHGRPSARVVLLKGVDERGFTFFTNLESQKSRELSESPLAALVFYWDPLSRQVRVEGVVERVDQSEAEAYFQTRSRGSQLGAWASPQSRRLESRAELEAEVARLDAEFGESIPLPPHWGGWRVVPDRIEFWSGRPNRLHDRFNYTRGGDAGWRIERLSP